MRKNLFGSFLLFIMVLFTGLLSASGFDVIPSESYDFPVDGNFPPVLNVGEAIECGDYTFRIMYPPVLAKSFQAMIASKDLKYLTMRVGITNNSEETIGWIAPDSFQVQEIIRNQLFGTYKLDYLMSAKAAAGYSWKAFYSAIAPGETLQTLIVFSVFQEANDWIFYLSPHMFGESSKETVKFRLPAVTVQ